MNKFVTFEGVDGSGKSALIKQMADYLKKQKIEFVETREPGGLKVCEEIREILKYSDQNIDDRTELLLFSASRAELTNKIILPSLKNNKVVLCDRYFDSTRVYQGFAKNVDDDQIMQITSYATNGLIPTLTFVLDIDPKFAFERKGGVDKNDCIENRNLEYHNKVREGYLLLAKKESRFVVLDAKKPVETLLNIVINKLKEVDII